MVLCAVAPALLGLAGVLVLSWYAAPVLAVVLAAAVGGLLCVVATAALALRLVMSSSTTFGRLAYGVWAILERVAEYFPPLPDDDRGGGSGGGPEREPVDVLFEDLSVTTRGTRDRPAEPTRN